MVSLNRKQQGFTIVELLIVIVVIGILAGLVITTFNGIQQKARDTERQTDIKALHSQVEAYYAQNGKYPTLDNMNDNAAGSTTNFLATSLKGLDRESFRDPKGSSFALTQTTTANQYTYNVLPVACDNSTTDCASYTMSAKLEGKINGSDTFSQTSLNN